MKKITFLLGLTLIGMGCSSKKLDPLTEGQKKQLSQTAGNARSTYSSAQNPLNFRKAYQEARGIVEGLDFCEWEGDELPEETDLVNSIFFPSSNNKNGPTEIEIKAKVEATETCPVSFNFYLKAKINPQTNEVIAKLDFDYKLESDEIKALYDIHALALHLNIATTQTSASFDGDGFIKSKSNGHVDLYLNGGFKAQQADIIFGFVFSDFTAEIRWLFDENGEHLFLNNQPITEDELNEILEGRFGN